MKEITYLILLFIFFIVGCSTSPELNWKQEEGYRWAEVSPGFWDKTGFNSLSPSETNIHFANRLSKEKIAENRNLLNGSGVAAGDIDGDGLVDLYFARLDGANKLYKNKGNFQFKDITEEAGVAHKGNNSTGVVFSDIDGDGDLDLLVSSLTEKNALYINDGQGNFSLKEESGLGQSKGAATIALADIDGDGDLDIYITNYKEDTARDKYSIQEITLENMLEREGDTFSISPPFDEDYVLITDKGKTDVREVGEIDELYLNEGEGTFQKVSDLKKRFLTDNGDPLGLEKDWGLTAKFQDLNGDLLPDLYVANDFWTPDRVWINQGDGTFKSIGPHAIRTVSFSSMGVDFSDINRDGFVDIFVTEMLSPSHQQRMRQFVNKPPFRYEPGDTDHQLLSVQNTLQLNRGDHTFKEIAYYSGVEASGWSWATRFLDVDLDGYEDILINTGFGYDVQDLDTQEQLGRNFSNDQQKGKAIILAFPSLELSNQSFRNNGDLTFSNKSNEWGFNTEDISHGMAFADLDNDGDLDVITNRFNQKALVYENNTNEARISVRLNGNPPNTQGIGAKIELKGGPVRQQKQVSAGGDYLSGSETLTMFAAEENANHIISVTWPGGEQSIIDSVKANTIYEIEEPSTDTLREDIQKEKEVEGKYIFKDISDNISHTHHEENFNDFELQPLLPIKLSQLGPGISWIDFNRDGYDDLFIPSGKGGKLQVFENFGEGKFQSKDFSFLTDTSVSDQTSILGWNEGDQTNLVVGHSIYEQKQGKAKAASTYSITNDNINQKNDIPAITSVTGPLAVADYDNDGDLDLFVGGRFISGNYPLDASSRLLKKNGDIFELDEDNSKVFQEIGLVTAAVFTDFDQDGDQDIVLSTEWGSLKVFENQNGKFVEATESVGLENYKGWWNGVATGDFNGDGLPDIIATNIGLNSPYKLKSKKPLKIYYEDFDRDGTLEVLEAYYNEESESYVPRRQLYDLDNSIPIYTRKIETHREFSASSLSEILNTDLDNIRSREINTLQHMLFLNEGGKFSATPLPRETQLVNAFNIGIADLNNDGNEDVFLSQNNFSFPPTVPRQDAGRGLWLQGDGNGEFEPLSGNETGIKVYGEQRGAALSDINRDGKIDLAISQNGGETKLYLNQTEKSGATIRLVGPDTNRDAIGSSIRLIYEDGSKGPRREVQAGSGYWSQNSKIQIMGIDKNLSFIEVKWFDGSIQKVNIEEYKQEYRIKYSKN